MMNFMCLLFCHFCQMLISLALVCFVPWKQHRSISSRTWNFFFYMSVVWCEWILCNLVYEYLLLICIIISILFRGAATSLNRSMYIHISIPFCSFCDIMRMWKGFEHNINSCLSLKLDSSSLCQQMHVSLFHFLQSYCLCHAKSEQSVFVAIL